MFTISFKKMKSFNQLEGLVRAFGRANVINKFSTAYLHYAEIIHSDWIKIIMANLIRVLVFRIMELCFAEICLYIGSWKHSFHFEFHRHFIFSIKQRKPPQRCYFAFKLASLISTFQESS